MGVSGIRFPDEMVDIGALATNDKVLISDTSDLKKAKWIELSKLHSIKDFVKIYDSFDDFPEVGDSNTLYIDNSTNIIHYYADGEYKWITSKSQVIKNLKSTTETFIIRTNPVGVIEFKLLNNIVENSFVSVTNRNFTFDDSDVTYHCNSVSVTEKNIVNILVDNMYFDIDYPVGEKFQIQYWYEDASPVETSLTGITLSLLEHEVINNDNVVITMRFANSNNFPVDISQYIQLSGFSNQQHFVRKVPANSYVEVVYTYSAVPQGSYTFPLTGTLEDTITGIRINEKTSTLIAGNITKTQISSNTVKFILSVINTGTADALERVRFEVKTMPDYQYFRNRYTLLQTIIAGQSRLFTFTFEALPAGSYKVEAYLNNDTFLNDLDFTI